MNGTQQTEALRLADKYEIEGFLQDHRFAQDHWCRQAAAELRSQHARIAELEDVADMAIKRIAELESQLEAIGAGGVEPMRKPAAAPQAAVPLFWVRLLRDGLYEGPVHNNSVGGKMLRDEKPGEWHPLYLHAAAAHPSEGVPAQAGPVGYVALAALTSRTHADDYAECFVTEAALLENYPAAKAIAVFDHAAAQPAAQGLELANCKGGKWLTVVYHDIQPGDESRTIVEHPKVSALSWSHALHDRDAAIAAQAKQGARP